MLAAQELEPPPAAAPSPAGILDQTARLRERQSRRCGPYGRDAAAREHPADDDCFARQDLAELTIELATKQASDGDRAHDWVATLAIAPQVRARRPGLCRH